jgi:hypothetical protein
MRAGDHDQRCRWQQDALDEPRSVALGGNLRRRALRKQPENQQRSAVP